MQVIVSPSPTANGKTFVHLVGKSKWRALATIACSTDDEVAAARARFEQAIIDAAAKKQAARDERKAAREAALAKGHGYSVGDILYNTWGYDQTNVNFVQVVGAGARSVTVRAIGASVIESGFMCGHATPSKDAFTGEAKRITVRSYGSGNLYLPAGGGHSWSRWEGRPVSCSWYA